MRCSSINASTGPENTCGAPIGFDEALRAAERIVPNGTWTAIYPHDEGFRTWEIAMRTEGDTERGDARILADLECGTVSFHEVPESRSPRDTVETWLAGLHDGTAFGTPGEIIVSLIGLTPLVLAWTGIRMWGRGRSGQPTSGK
ncbi:MAG: PepSY domain-containing protein [Burkholderiales bacterium]